MVDKEVDNVPKMTDNVPNMVDKEVDNVPNIVEKEVHNTFMNEQQELEKRTAIEKAIEKLKTEKNEMKKLFQETIDNLKSDSDKLNKENENTILNLNNKLDEIFAKNEELINQKEDILRLYNIESKKHEEIKKSYQKIIKSNENKTKKLLAGTNQDNETIIEQLEIGKKEEANKY